VLAGRVEQGIVKPGDEVIFLPTHTTANPCVGKVRLLAAVKPNEHVLLHCTCGAAESLFSLCFCAERCVATAAVGGQKALAQQGALLQLVPAMGRPKGCSLLNC